MRSSFALRSQIEAALAERIPSALTPAVRMVREVMPTGIDAVDAVLQGGLPVGALTETIGPECSGRTALALSFVAQATRAEKVCAWVDVSDALSPESAAACGVDLARLLWVRCGVARVGSGQFAAEGKGSFSLPAKYLAPPMAIKGLHGGGMGGHPRGEVKGMGPAVSGLLRVEPRCAEPQQRVRPERKVFELEAAGDCELAPRAKLDGVNAIARPWARIEQALRVTDLLMQAGGFAAIVLDMGSLTPEHVSRIPLATWFRYRAAAERTQASVVLLTQYPCSKSSAGLVLRLESGEVATEGETVLTGFEWRAEVARRRFAEPEKVIPMRKPPQRAGVAVWRSQTAWAVRR
jgi:hypothetical protein